MVWDLLKNFDFFGFLTHPTSRSGLWPFLEISLSPKRGPKTLKNGVGGSLPTSWDASFDTPLDYIRTIFSLSLSTFTFYFYFPQKVKVKPLVWMVLIWVSRESPRRMWLNSNSGWSLSPTQFWESKDSTFRKVLFRKGPELDFNLPIWK